MDTITAVLLGLFAWGFLVLLVLAFFAGAQSASEDQAEAEQVVRSANYALRTDDRGNFYIDPVEEAS
jgi:hypothetical protein